VTKSQDKVFAKLRKRQTNSSDVVVVETSETYCVFFVAFPGLYLTYDRMGKLLETETVIERTVAGKSLAKLGDQGDLILSGEMGG
jgi:hypothetical protein